MQPLVQATEVVLQVLPVGRPRHLVHPRRGVRVDRPIRSPEPVDVHMVQQRGEPCLLVSYCHLPHTVQRTWRVLPGAESGTRLLAVFPLVDPLPSTGSAVATATLFVGFAGTTGPSDFPHPFIPGLPPRRSLGVPPVDQRRGQARDLPVLAHEGSVHALVL